MLILLCASAIISNNEENINGEYMQKLKNVLEKLISEDKEVQKETRVYLFVSFKNDDDIQNIVMDILVKKLKEDNKEENKKENNNADKENLNNLDNNKELNLSAVTYGDSCNEYAESQNAVEDVLQNQKALHIQRLENFLKQDLAKMK